MNILVLAQNYPSKDNIYALAYIHSRNIEYLKNGHNIHVISFSTDVYYNFEGIEVFNEKSYENLKTIDIVVSHAPNLRNHLRYLVSLKKNIPLVFFFHGHEIMNISKYYPKEYSYRIKSYIFSKFIQKVYDLIKLKILKKFLVNSIKKRNVLFVFVSKWMKELAFESLSLDSKDVENFEQYSYIVNNGVNNVFLENTYNINSEKEADFVTIRPFDDPKYGIDIVYNIAKNNPKYIFHVYGKGDFFNHKEELDNLKIFNHYIHQKEMPNYLNKYKCALMPTRLDAQGVMMCEISTYGMPLITSDISICREMLKSFSNVLYIPNTLEKFDISRYIPMPTSNDEKNNKFDIVKLAKEEQKLYKTLVHINE